MRALEEATRDCCSAICAILSCALSRSDGRHLFCCLCYSVVRTREKQRKTPFLQCVLLMVNDSWDGHCVSKVASRPMEISAGQICKSTQGSDDESVKEIQTGNPHKNPCKKSVTSWQEIRQRNHLENRWKRCVSALCDSTSFLSGRRS